MKKKLFFVTFIFIACLIFFIPTQKAVSSNVIENGIYTISSRLDEDLLVTVSGRGRDDLTNVEISLNENKQHQKFKITNIGGGYYKIEAMHSGKVLDVYKGENKNGANVEQYKWINSKAQMWKIVDVGNGYYSFVSKANGKYLDVNGGIAKSGTNIQTWESNNTKGQQFKLNKVEFEKGSKTIEDGRYVISMAVDNSRALQAKNASKDNAIAMCIGDNNACTAQRFDITYLGDGYYKIIAVYSGRALDVYQEDSYDGARVQQYNWHNSDGQKWIIKSIGNGQYSIISKCNNLYLDIPRTSTTIGTEAQCYSGNGSSAQKFVLTKVTEVEPKKTIEDGVYSIKLPYDQSKVADVAHASHDDYGNVQVYKNSYNQNQKFRIEEISGTGYYKITSIESGKVLDVNGAGQTNGTNVQQYKWVDSSAQKWIITKTSDGYYKFISRSNSLCLDVNKGDSSNRTNIQVWESNNTDAQKFILEKVQIYPNGTYEMETKLNSNYVVDITGGNHANSTKAEIWTANGGDNQQFIVTYNKEDDTYTILAKHSNKALTTNKAGNVYQDKKTGSDSQKWIIKEAGNGYYYLISKLNGMYLSVDNNKAQNGSTIYTYKYSGKDGQKFKLYTGIRRFFEEGTYGKSGLAVNGDSRGSDLKYYKYGRGNNVFFAVFSVHGFEDSYSHDGEELTYIAEQFNYYLSYSNDTDIYNNWTIYIFPNANPDGQVYGWTNNGPGRTSLISSAPNKQGIDINRNWQVSGESYVRYSDARNYNGTSGFQSYEARYLRDFLLSHKSSNGKNVLIDLHGWLNESIGDDGLGVYYRKYFNLPTHIGSYGRGYLINWARKNIGRSALIELPEISNHNQSVSRRYSDNFIWATLEMLRGI